MVSAGVLTHPSGDGVALDHTIGVIPTRLYSVALEAAGMDA